MHQRKRTQKIRVNSEDVVAIDSLLRFVQKLQKKDFSLDLIISNEEFLFDQYISTLTSLKDDLKAEE